jgi:hypothetical protein
MSGDWRRKLWTLLVAFCIVIIRYTETFWSPCTVLREWFCITEVESVYCAVRTESLHQREKFRPKKIEIKNLSECSAKRGYWASIVMWTFSRTVNEKKRTKGILLRIKALWSIPLFCLYFHSRISISLCSLCHSVPFIHVSMWRHQ